MIVSIALLVATVILLAAGALMIRQGLSQKLGQIVSMSTTNRRPKVAVPAEPRAAREPTYCYNDCVRVHEHTFPNFPCSAACSMKDGSHS
jgi:hypothetical protein